MNRAGSSSARNSSNNDDNDSWEKVSSRRGKKAQTPQSPRKKSPPSPNLKRSNPNSPMLAKRTSPPSPQIRRTTPPSPRSPNVGRSPHLSPSLRPPPSPGRISSTMSPSSLRSPNPNASRKKGPPSSPRCSTPKMPNQPCVEELKLAESLADDAVSGRKDLPLRYRWVIWFDEASSTGTTKQAWNNKLSKLAWFDTVQEMWATLNAVVDTRDMPNNTNFRIFKDGIEPTWEDPANKGAGKFTFRTEKALTPTAWLYLLLGLFGDQLGIASVVNGVVLSLKSKEDRIHLWMAANHNLTVQELRKHMRCCADLFDRPYKFQPHEDRISVNLASLRQQEKKRTPQPSPSGGGAKSGQGRKGSADLDKARSPFLAPSPAGASPRNGGSRSGSSSPHLGGGGGGGGGGAGRSGRSRPPTSPDIATALTAAAAARILGGRAESDDSGSLEAGERTITRGHLRGQEGRPARPGPRGGASTDQPASAPAPAAVSHKMWRKNLKVDIPGSSNTSLTSDQDDDDDDDDDDDEFDSCSENSDSGDEGAVRGRSLAQHNSATSAAVGVLPNVSVLQTLQNQRLDSAHEKESKEEASSTSEEFFESRSREGSASSSMLPSQSQSREGSFSSHSWSREGSLSAVLPGLNIPSPSGGFARRTPPHLPATPPYAATSPTPNSGGSAGSNRPDGSRPSSSTPPLVPVSCYPEVRGSSAQTPTDKSSGDRGTKSGQSQGSGLPPSGAQPTPSCPGGEESCPQATTTCAEGNMSQHAQNSGGTASSDGKGAEPADTKGAGGTAKEKPGKASRSTHVLPRKESNQPSAPEAATKATQEPSGNNSPATLSDRDRVNVRRGEGSEAGSSKASAKAAAKAAEAAKPSDTQSPLPSPDMGKVEGQAAGGGSQKRDEAEEVAAETDPMMIRRSGLSSRRRAESLQERSHKPLTEDALRPRTGSMTETVRDTIKDADEDGLTYYHLSRLTKRTMSMGSLGSYSENESDDGAFSVWTSGSEFPSESAMTDASSEVGSDWGAPNSQGASPRSTGERGTGDGSDMSRLELPISTMRREALSRGRLNRSRSVGSTGSSGKKRPTRRGRGGKRLVEGREAARYMGLLDPPLDDEGVPCWVVVAAKEYPKQQQQEGGSASGTTTHLSSTEPCSPALPERQGTTPRSRSVSNSPDFAPTPAKEPVLGMEGIAGSAMSALATSSTSPALPSAASPSLGHSQAQIHASPVPQQQSPSTGYMSSPPSSLATTPPLVSSSGREVTQSLSVGLQASYLPPGHSFIQTQYSQFPAGFESMAVPMPPPHMPITHVDPTALAAAAANAASGHRFASYAIPTAVGVPVGSVNMAHLPVVPSTAYQCQTQPQSHSLMHSQQQQHFHVSPQAHQAHPQHFPGAGFRGGLPHHTPHHARPHNRPSPPQPHLQPHPLSPHEGAGASGLSSPSSGSTASGEGSSVGSGSTTPPSDAEEIVSKSTLSVTSPAFVPTATPTTSAENRGGDGTRARGSSLTKNEGEAEVVLLGQPQSGSEPQDFAWGKRKERKKSRKKG